MDATTLVTMRCTACGVLTPAACNCRAPYELYMPPGQRAEQAVKDNPGLSDRAIADKIGVGNKTVSRARKATVSNDTVEPRLGKDGKKRRKPTGRPRGRPPGVTQAQRSINIRPEVWEEVKLRATQAGIPAADLIGQLLTSTTEIDPKTLPKTAQEKLAIALRQQQRMQNAEFEKRVAAEYTARVRQGFPELEKMEREARDTQRTYERLLRESKKLGTQADWNNLVMCLHPDTRRGVSDERLDRALAWVQARKFAITGEK
jgi:hypothetical protein